MVTKYLECGPDTEYDVVQILMVSNLKGTYQPIDRGSITVVIRYKRLYIINNTSPLVLSFTLGTDIRLHSVLGIPCLLAMSAIVDLAKGQLVFSELNKNHCHSLTLRGKGCQMVLPLNLSLLLYMMESLPIFQPWETYSSNILHPIAQLPQYFKPLILVIL